MTLRIRTGSMGALLVVLACGSSSENVEGEKKIVDATKDASTTTPIPGIPPVSPIDDGCANALSGPFEESMPAPETVVVEADDHSVRLQWDGSLGRNTEDFKQTIEGYRVCWGPSEKELKHGSLFTDRIAQIFGVPNGEPQVAIVQAVDQRGRVSKPSKIVSFTGTTSRIDKLRSAMTGFFDDFNTTPGALDELRWNVAFSDCNDPTVSHMYVGDQQHALGVLGNHSFLPGSKGGCDRDQLIARPRSVFDFTGREGKIAFDFDGTDGNRSTWYLDLFPYTKQADLIDITGHITFDPGPGHPGRFLRISQSGNLLTIHQMQANGEADEAHLKKTDIFYDHPDQRLYPGNVMRHWEVRVTKNRAAIYLDGSLVLENREVNLDFERSFVHFAQFGYNPAKVDRPWNQIHWDNFGFDGPRSPIVTQNYKSSFSTADTFHVGYPAHKATWAVNLPDSLAGASRARFMYTIQTHAYKWSATDHFMLNGKKFLIPEPKSSAGTWQDGILGAGYPPFSTQIELPLDALVAGMNEFRFEAENTTIVSPHVEIDFDNGTGTTFTQPSKYLKDSPVPALTAIGPESNVNAINKKLIWERGSTMEVQGFDVLLNKPCDDFAHQECHRHVRTPLSGTVTVDCVVDLNHALVMHGRNFGIAKVELLIDGNVVANVSTSNQTAAPGIYDGPFSWNQPHDGGIPIPFDSTKLTNGEHQLIVRATDSIGTVTRNRVDPTQQDPLYIVIKN